MESRYKTDMVMASTRSIRGVGLRVCGVQVLGYRGFLMVALLFVAATTFVIEDVHCSITTEAVASLPTPSTERTPDIWIFHQYEADALNAVFKKWSKQNPQLYTFLNWTLEQHPCDNLPNNYALLPDNTFSGAWSGIGCTSELINATELARYHHISVRSLEISGSNFGCLDNIMRPMSAVPCGFDGIIGQLPSEISNLTNLQDLIINHNPRLTGPVPVELFQMPTLTSLDLSNNYLSGPLPSDDYHPDCRLETLHLSNNNFGGSLQVSSNGTLFSSSLYILDLSNNSLSGTLPSDVYNIDCRLYTLDLSNNHFSGSLRVSSNGTLFCPYLYDLNVGYNQLDGPIELPYWNFKSQDFSSLNFSNNHFGATFSIGPYVDVWRLDLSYNDFTSIRFANYSTSTQFNGSGIVYMPSLQYLNISNNNFSSPFLEELFQMPALSKLDLSVNYFGGSIDFGSLNETTNLNYLNISNNNFNGTFFTGAYLNSSIMDLSNNQFNDIKFYIHNKTTPSDGSVFLPLLQEIYFQNNNLKGDFPAKILTAPNLQILDASQNEYHSLQLPILRIDNFKLSQIFIRNNKLGVVQDPKRGPLSFYNLQFLSLLFLGGNPICDKIENMVLASICRMNRTNEPQPEFDKKEVKPNLYSYREVKLATNNFDKKNKLGEGGFGVVYKGELFDGTQVAVKKLTMSSKQVLHEFLNEVIVISGLKHRNLVKLKGCCLGDGDQRILVFEYVENNNLAEALWMHGDLQSNMEPPSLDWEKRFNIIVGIARRLAYLHEELQPPIIHRDIKATNILLDKNYNPKIADFGLAYLFPALDSKASHLTLMQVAGTRGYFSPEYALQGHVSTALDVYSFGILVLEIVSGRKNINLQKPSEEIYLREWAWKQYEAKTTMTLIDPKMEYSPLALDAIMRVIVVNFKRTLNMEKKLLKFV